ncbi:MAG: argininosuccinate lyase [Candidatus Omnitrophota bacterium]|nr:argininosuccinate lyase [Candidatus Omnitrophota bacterium]
MSKKLWGGRFSKKTDPLVEEFTKSIQYDYILAECDLIGSIYHVAILKKAKILKAGEAAKLEKALNGILKSVKRGSFKIDMKSEDIHTNIQNILQEKVGDLALKLHTARSRNDQVVFSTKLCAKAKVDEIKADIAKFTVAIESLAGKNRDIIIPGLTHMQHAQPVYLKDHLTAYSHMLYKDGMRLECIERTIEMTMGSGALAGTPIAAANYNIKGCVEPTTNSLYSVSDRDFVIEILNALAITGMHLSRLAEDLILWSTKEFDFIKIDDAFCTGSSLMPQKRNPDVLELIRGYSGRLLGNAVSVMTMMKGLPLTYNRDMQLDKEPLFNSFEIVSSELRVMAGLIKTLKFNKVKIEEHLEDESLYATDLVYYLVKKGIAFKNAHNIIGDLVKHSIDSGIEIKSMTNHELARFSDKFKSKEIIRLFDPKVSVESKRSVKR